MADATISTGIEADYGTVAAGVLSPLTAAVGGFDPDLGQIYLARTDTAQFVGYHGAENEGPEFPTSGDVNTAALSEGDWVRLTKDDSLTQTVAGGRLESSALIEGQEYEQGLVKGGSSSSARIELFEEDKPEIRLYVADPSHQPGKLTASGNNTNILGTYGLPATEQPSSEWHAGTTGNSYVSLNPRARFPEVASTGSAASNTVYVYAKDKAGTSALYAKDDAGTEHELTGWAADAILKTFMAAKGDLITASANDTPTILSVGANGTTLTADSAATNGVKWGPPSRSHTVQGFLANAAASLTAQQMASAGTALAQAVMPWAGAITGLSVVSNEARLAGTLTVEVYKNGAGTGFTVVLDGTNTTRWYGTQAMTADTFAAGDYLDLRVTTTATWLPITADITADLWVQWTA